MKERFLSLKALCPARSMGPSLAAFLLIFAGVWLRFAQYFNGRSLWLDEAKVALNVLDWPLFSGLMVQPFNQAAPPAFVFFERLVSGVFGGSEVALRSLPLVFGLASLAVFFLLSKRWLAPAAGLLALGLFALSDSLIFYSAELKQYSADVFFSLLLLAAARLILSRGPEKKWVILFAAAGSVGVWFSHPAVLVVCSEMLVLCLYFYAARRRTAFRAFFGILCLPLVSAALLYHLMFRGLLHNQALFNYWSGGFPDLTRPWPQWIRWTLRAVARELSYATGLRYPWITGALFLFSFGVVNGFRKASDRLSALSLVLPLVAALTAAWMFFYPFYGRLALFLAPFVILLTAKGFEPFVRKWGPKRLGIILLVLFAAYGPLRGPSPALSRHSLPDREEMKPVLRYAIPRMKGGDTLYLFYGSKYAFWYYSRFFNLGYDFRRSVPQLKIKNSAPAGSSADGAVYLIYGEGPRRGSKKYFEDLDQLKGRQRVWILFAHTIHVIHRINEKEATLRYLSKSGKELEAFSAEGSSIHLFDLSGAVQEKNP